MEMNYDERELHQIEQELDVEIIPGTEIMADVGTHHFVKGGEQVLVPQPSSDKHDPLNWSPLWKALCITAASSVSFTQALGPLALAPMFPDYIEAFDSNLTDVVRFTGVAILVLGFSNFIWVPINSCFGRRPVYIISQIINFGASIWRAKATTYGSFMGACVLNGIAAGPAESIQPAVNADIFFLHERGFWNTVYWVSYIGSLTVGPVFSGSIALHVGWRNFWWFNTAMIGASFLMVVFMFPETKWHRLHPGELQEHLTSRDDELSNKSKNEVQTSAENVKSLGDFGGVSNPPQHQDETNGNTNKDPWLRKGFPSKQQWRLYQSNSTPWKSIVANLWIPWKLFAFPVVEFSSFVVSWSCSVFLSINLTQSQVFAAPPYNYNSQDIGFFNFAVLVGTLIGLATAGPLSDWVSARATRKNRGVREPEMRLPAMIPYVCIMIFGNFIVAFGYQQKWPWEAIVVVGYTCAGIQVAALPAIATTYAVDSYKPVAASLMVSATVNKNVWGYGISAFITPWILESDSYLYPILTNMCLATLWCAFGIPFYFYGKRLRRWSRKSSVHTM